MSGVSHHGFSYVVKSSVEHREIWFTLTHTEIVIYTGYRRNVLLDDVGGAVTQICCVLVIMVLVIL